MSNTWEARSGTSRDGSPVVLPVHLKDAGFTYPGAGEPAVSGVSLEIHAGEYVGVVGANGGGKSTLVRLLNGLLVADRGDVRVFGLNPAQEAADIRRRVGMLFQNPDNGLVAPFVEDDIAFGLENLGVEPGDMRGRVAAAIEAVGLGGYERRETATLSGGEKQRVALAGLLAVEPDLLVLDEPTSMLDPAGRRDVLSRLETLRGTRTIVHVTHHLEELANADRVVVMVGGEVVADVPPERLFNDVELMERANLSPPVVARLASELGIRTGGGVEDLASEILIRGLGREPGRGEPG